MVEGRLRVAVLVLGHSLRITQYASSSLCSPLLRCFKPPMTGLVVGGARFSAREGSGVGSNPKLQIPNPKSLLTRSSLAIWDLVIGVWSFRRSRCAREGSEVGQKPGFPEKTWFLAPRRVKTQSPKMAADGRPGHCVCVGGRLDLLQRLTIPSVSRWLRAGCALQCSSSITHHALRIIVAMQTPSQTLQTPNGRTCG